MQLKQNNDPVDNPNVNGGPNTNPNFNGNGQSAFTNNTYYNNTDATQTPYTNPMGASQDPRSQGYGGQGMPNQGRPMGPNQGMPQGRPMGSNQGMPQGRPMGGSPYRSDEPVMKSKSGINPLFIIIPVLVILLIIGVSQFKKVFGKANYIPGVVSGTTYTNEYFDVKVDLGSGWDIVSYSGTAEQEKEDLNIGRTITEFEGSRDISYEAFNINVSQTPYNIKESGTNTEKLVKSLENDYKNELEGRGFTINEITQDKMTVAGKTCDGVILNCTYTEGSQSMNISMAQFFVFKGNYVMIVTTGSTSDGKAKLIITNYLKKND